MIIGINGYAGSGKDTVGKLIQELQPEMNWQIRKFAGKLKQIATILTGIPEEKFEDQEFKKNNLSHEWNIQSEFNPPTRMTVRNFLQKLGTDAMRDGLHTNVWVNAIITEYTRPIDLELFLYANDYTEERNLNNCEGIPFSGEHLQDYYDKVKLPNWIITDTRFKNEAQAIKDKGGIIMRIDRPGVSPINTHPSEIELDDWTFDYRVANASDFYSLKQTVEQILKHAKLL